MSQRMISCLSVLCLVSQAVTSGSVALAATPFDGTYHGTFYASGAGNGRCGAGGDVTVKIVDGTFKVHSSNRNDLVATKVAPDGSFSVQAGARFIHGGIRGNDLTATASDAGGRCTYLWSLKK